MTANRTLYARNAFAAASLALIGSLAAAPAQARQPGGAPAEATAARTSDGDGTRPLLVLRTDRQGL
jgi:hypothetical protein